MSTPTRSDVLAAGVVGLLTVLLLAGMNRAFQLPVVESAAPAAASLAHLP